MFSLARAEGGGAGCAGDGMGRAGWETRGEGHRGMRVMTHRDGYGGAHAVTTAGHTRDQQYERTGQAERQYTTASAGQSQRAWIFTSIHLVALLASWFHKLTMAGSGALLHRANQQCFEGAQCKGFGRGVGSSDDIPSATNRGTVLSPFGGCRGEPPRDGHVPRFRGASGHNEKFWLNCQCF